jgi:hypothetical protein
MQIPIKILTGSIQDKDIEYFTFSYLHGSWLFILWFHWGFCNEKKERLGFFPDLTISKRQRRRNMAIELDSRHPLLPKIERENEDLTLILRGKKDFFADTSAFNARCKGIKHENKHNYIC